MWAVVVWETLEFSQYRAVLFNRQTAKYKLLKEPLCSYSAWITLTFKSTKQVSTGECTYHIHHAGNMHDHLEVLSLFMKKSIFDQRDEMCCSTFLSTPWCYTTFWTRKPSKPPHTRVSVESEAMCRFAGDKQDVFSYRWGSILWLTDDTTEGMREL